MLFKYKLLLCLPLLLFTTLQAQVAYEHFNTDNGLPSNEVYCVYEDTAGYTWFGTDHGAVRYNGSSFEIFSTTNGLTDNTVFSIKQDEQGLIWFLTYAGGICYFDGKKVHPHPNNDTIIALCSKRIPVSWCVHKNKRLWLSFVTWGISCVDSSEINNYLAEGPRNLKAEDSLTFSLIGLKNGGYIYVSYGTQQKLAIPATEQQYRESWVVSTKTFWEASNNFNLYRLQNGALIYSQWNKLFFKSAATKKETLWPPSIMVVKLTQTADGRIWVLNKNGASYAMEQNGDSLQVVDSIIFAKSSSDLILSRQGHYWLCTLDNGVYMIPNQKVKLFTSDDFNMMPRFFSLSTGNNSLYAGLTQNYFLKIGETGASELVRNYKYPGDVSDVFLDENKFAKTNADLSGELREDIYINKLITLNNGSLLAGGTGGFVVLKKHQVVFHSKIIGFSKKVMAICPLSDSIYLLGTFRGLFYLNIKSGYSVTEDKRFEGIRITACKSRNSNMYAVATRGKGVYLQVNGISQFIGTRQGLATDLAEDVCFENDTTLWIASYQGLYKITFKVQGQAMPLTMRCYTRADGIVSEQINAIGAFNGYLWLATNNGLNYFKPDALKRDTLMLPLLFTAFNVNGEKHSLTNLILKPYQNNISVDFGALYYKSHVIRYKFRLKGINDWKYTEINTIQFFALPAGDYQLEVVAEDKYGHYKSNVRVLQFTIQPKMVDTWWFKWGIGLLVFLIVALLAYLFFRYQKFKADNVIHLLQTEFKALNYQINPHFIFNVLNSIQYYILHKESEKAVYFLNSFSMLIRRIVGNSSQQLVSVIEEVECLKEYLDLEKLRLEDKFTYEINIDSGINIEEKILLPMIIQPLVENSIWHGIVPVDYKGRIRVDFSLVDDELVCVVDDNGVGLKNSAIKMDGARHLSIAMSNVKERLKIISELNGSSWYIRVEDKMEKGLNEPGTLVTIKFPKARKTK